MSVKLNELKVCSVIKENRFGNMLQINSKKGLEETSKHWGNYFSGYKLDKESIFYAGGYYWNKIEDGLSVYIFHKEAISDRLVELFRLLATSKNGFKDEIFYYKTNEGLVRIDFVHQVQNILDEFKVCRRIYGGSEPFLYSDV